MKGILYYSVTYSCLLWEASQLQLGKYHSVIYSHLKGSCKYSIYISQCHLPSPQRKLQIFNLYITVSFAVTSKEAANIQFIYHSVIYRHLKGSCKYSIYISQCHSLSPQRKMQIMNKSCQKTTMLAGRQPSLNSSHG